MIIEHLNLVNYCQHRELTVSFCPGLNAIVGPIGSGKSNILKAIRFLFTNKSGNAGKKEDDITYSLEGGSPSFVSMTGSHHNVGFELFRSLQGSRRYLKWADEPLRVTVEREIAENLKNRLGVDQSVFDEFIVVNQGKLSAIIDMTPADRMAALQGLVGLDRFAQLYTWLGNYATELPLIVTSETEEGLTAAITSLTSQVEEAEKQQQIITAEDTEKFQFAQDTLAKVSKLDDLLSQKKTLSDELSFLVNTQREKADLAARLESAVSISQQHLDQERAREQERSSIVTKLLLFSQWKNTNNRMLQCQQLLKEMEIPAWVFPRDALQPTPQMQQAEQQLNVLLHMRNLLSKAANKICPTCFQPLKDELFVSLESIPQFENYLSSERNRLNQSIAFWSSYNSWQNNAKQAQAEIENIKKSLLSFPADVESYGDLKPIPAADFSLSQLEYAHNQKAAQLVEAQRTVSELVATIRIKSESLKKLEEQILIRGNIGEQYSTAQLNDLTKFVREYRDKQQKQAEAKGALVVLQQQLEAAKEKLKTFRVEAAKAQKFRDFRTDILAARDVFHRNNLPSHLSKEALSSLAGQMNEVLDSFGATYRLCESKDGAFSVRFFDESFKGIQPDTRLSGGERSQFGLAMRIASHSLWAQDLGFMALDEPTYGFSQEDLRCVEVAIEHLRKLSTERGLQIIVITHEKSLLPLFDKVISLR